MSLVLLAAAETHLVLRDALSVIIGLVLIEGLLSVDNALAIAAMASHLDPRHRPMAMNLGYAGAYGFRLLALLFAATIFANMWVKLAGALYLIWLMCSHFALHHREQDGDAADMVHRSLASTITMIALMDLSLSVDNVVAAIALSPNDLWPVYVGVTIGIICLRLVAGLAIKMIERYPVLEHTAFLLVGYVGFMLLGEVWLGIRFEKLTKLGGIFAIIAASLLYARHAEIHGLLKPLFRPLLLAMQAVSKVTDLVIGALCWPVRALAKGK